MKKALFDILIATVTMGIIISSCKKEYSCENCNVNGASNAGNMAPIAIAGPDQATSLPKDSVLLDGSASNDPDGKIIKWQWTKLSGPSSFAIKNLDSAKAIVRLLVQGIYQFELTVTDEKGARAKDTVQITVNASGAINHPPVACAGIDQTIDLLVNSVTLDGTCSTDPDNNITVYLWTKISGPSTFNIANADLVKTTVTNLSEGTYLFQLKLTDASGLTSFDTMQVIVRQMANNSLVDVYVAGMEGGKAKYWKNGQGVVLSHQFGDVTATSIAVVGNDVYVAGWEGDFLVYGNTRAKYWKNGQEVNLTGITGAGANSIAVNGSDVYVAGWEFSGTKTVAKYWKNGREVALTNGLSDAEATCIVISGNNVYVSGHEDGVAKYWKNGLPVILTDGLHQAYANSIAVDGNNIYVAGSESNGSAQVAKYWKNGSPVSLTSGSAVSASAGSITVNAGDVYVAGWEGDFYGRAGGSGSVAKYWKNAQVSPLTNGTTYAYVSSIAVFGGDVYVCGQEISGSVHTVKYWKNGQPVTLSDNGGYVGWARSIAVVPR